MPELSIYSALGRAIAARRRALELSQDQVARRAGFSRASLANIERGRQNVYLHHIMAIAEALELSSARDLIPDAAPELAQTGDKMSASQWRRFGALVHSDQATTSA